MSESDYIERVRSMAMMADMAILAPLRQWLFQSNSTLVPCASSFPMKPKASYP